MPASLYNQSQIHQSVGGYNNSSELSMDPIGGGLIDNRNGGGTYNRLLESGTKNSEENSI